MLAGTENAERYPRSPCLPRRPEIGATHVGEPLPAFGADVAPAGQYGDIFQYLGALFAERLRPDQGDELAGGASEHGQ